MDVYCMTTMMISPQGRLLYTIPLDFFNLNPKPNYLSIDMDGNFVCAANLDKVVVWSSKNGRFVCLFVCLYLGMSINHVIAFLPILGRPPPSL